MSERQLKSHRSVQSVLEFVGWEKMKELQEKALSIYGLREAAMTATLFTGGFRVSEVVRSDHGGLKPENIIAVGGKKMLRFSAVQVMKKYKKVPGTGYICHETGAHKGHAVWDADHKHFETVRRVGKEIVRNCSAPLYEPLISNIREYVHEVSDGEYLFPFDRFRAYRVVEKLSTEIWPHWFRSQRASQLGARIEKGGYEWNKAKMKIWFKWSTEKTAEIYAHEDEVEALESEFPDRLIGT